MLPIKDTNTALRAVKGTNSLPSPLCSIVLGQSTDSEGCPASRGVCRAPPGRSVLCSLWGCSPPHLCALSAQVPVFWSSQGWPPRATSKAAHCRGCSRGNISPPAPLLILVAALSTWLRKPTGSPCIGVAAGKEATRSWPGCGHKPICSVENQS